MTEHEVVIFESLDNYCGRILAEFAVQLREAEATKNDAAVAVLNGAREAVQGVRDLVDGLRGLIESGLS